jgi:hypothetical protein
MVASVEAEAVASSRTRRYTWHHGQLGCGGHEQGKSVGLCSCDGNGNDKQCPQEYSTGTKHEMRTCNGNNSDNGRWPHQRGDQQQRSMLQ